MIASLRAMCELGNTLVVVEHDEDTMRAADYLIDIGPGAGIEGGQVMAAGTPKQVARSKRSLTGQYLAGKNIFRSQLPDVKEMEILLRSLEQQRIILRISM